MSIVKKILFLILFSIIIIKIFDSIFPIFIEYEVINKSHRAIPLHEFGSAGKYKTLPTKKYMQSVDTLEKKQTVIKVDNNGFISNSKEKTKKDKINIIFFGGSTTESMYVDENLRFPYLVGRMLSDHKGHEVNSVNSGVSGNNSFNSLIQLISKGIHHKPDLAIIMNNVNDWSLLSKTNSYHNAPKSKLVIKDYGDENLYSFAINIKDLILPNSWNHIRRFIKNPFKSQFEEDSFEGLERFKYQPQEIEAIYRSSIISFINICINWNIKPVLMTQMSRLKINGDLPIDMNESNVIKAQKYQDLFNEILRDISQNYSVDLIDLDKELSGSKIYIYDSVHLNEKGSQEAAKIIYNSLKLLI